MKNTQIKLIGQELGQLLDGKVDEITVNRFASALSQLSIRSEENPYIISPLHKLIYDWVNTIWLHRETEAERLHRLVTFCFKITPEHLQSEVMDLLIQNGVHKGLVDEDIQREFNDRRFHPTVDNHCRKLFLEGNYFHAVFEACKAYDRAVQLKSGMERDYGVNLMKKAWGKDGELRLPTDNSVSGENFAEGIKSLSVGLMKAVRNVTAHEPAASWPIEREDCLDMLGFISFLFRHIDLTHRETA